MSEAPFNPRFDCEVSGRYCPLLEICETEGMAEFYQQVPKQALEMGACEEKCKLPELQETSPGFARALLLLVQKK